jgi:hypothetical protein
LATDTVQAMIAAAWAKVELTRAKLRMAMG